MAGRVLMCAPEFFGVEYVINPWMEGHVGCASVSKARQQWDQLHGELSDRVNVQLIKPGKYLPDMCFAANGGLVVENRFVRSVFRVTQRQPEESPYRQWFRDQGFEVFDLPDDEPFEGEGDALVHPGQPLVWAGYGVRSSLESHRRLTELLNVEVVSLRLVDERFYHLDTCFFPLANGRVVYYPSAFDEPSLREIRRRVPPQHRIRVDESDGLRFACNAVVLDDAIITNHASDELRKKLAAWGYTVIICPVDEFMLAGGAVKCLTLLLDQDLGPDSEKRKLFESPARTSRLSLTGHLLDTGLLNRAVDVITDAGGSCRVEEFTVGERRDQISTATLRVTATDGQRLDTLVGYLLPLGAHPSEAPEDVELVSVTQDGVAPETFYSSTIYPTDVRVDGEWIRVGGQRMDAIVTVEEDQAPSAAYCRLIRDLRSGDRVVCGVKGVRIITPSTRGEEGDEFAFMSASVSSERRVELAVETVAWEMRRIRARQGKMVVTAGPVVIHTGGGRHLVKLIEMGYVQSLLTGNALPVHDIELNMFGTSLGVDLGRGVGIPGGHTHHLRAINTVRSAGSIANAVKAGHITGGVMHACVKNKVEYVLAGSIRDDGPLPDTLMDLVEAQAAYARVIEGADMILMLSSMLHAIGTGNMTPAGVRLVCVDISPAVVTKLADRGSVESTGIVTDVGLFLNLLARRLEEPDEA
jgi:lysine-ketoglutarate reductase/saccharopine dehydrogenase-like protein (TIGR00300 family)